MQAAHTLLPIEEALAQILAQVHVLSTEMLELTACAGRYLAADALADDDQPAFDRAMMDGVAVRSAETAAASAVLRQVGQTMAGHSQLNLVAPATCVRVMTGGVLPEGADAIVPVERIQRVDDEHWRILDATRPEQHIARRGSELRAGEPVVHRGQQLHGARIGALAAFGHANVCVAQRPQVALLPNGDELVAIDAAVRVGEVRDSNRYALTALLQQAGAEVSQCAAAIDTFEGLRDAITSAWQSADIVVLSGGASAGDRDFVAPVLSDLGARIHVRQIRIKPGKPFLFATRDLADGRRQLAFGLPGNPLASYVCAALFVLPALVAMQGGDPAWQIAQLPSARALPAIGPRTELLPANVISVAGAAQIDVLTVRSSADLPHFAAGQWLAIRQAHAPALAIGEAVDFLLWPRI